MTTLEHLRAAAMVRSQRRQREIPLDDFSLVGERVPLPTSTTKPLRAVDMPGPKPPENLVAPIQEKLI